MAKQWRCFFCDEVFKTRRDAANHFGESLCESDVPACVDPLRTDEKLRMIEVRDARAYAMKMQQEAEETQNDADLLYQYRRELERLFGKDRDSPYAAWQVLDVANGEIEALKLRLSVYEGKHNDMATENRDRHTAAGGAHDIG
jgi:hypothetical protein